MLTASFTTKPAPEKGIVVLAFGPLTASELQKLTDLCGPEAVLDTNLARMAGATFAVGPVPLLQPLRTKLATHSLATQAARAPGLDMAETAWLATGDRGTSSNTMFTVLTGTDALDDRQEDHPHDPDDFDRCLRLLAAAPRLRGLLPKMSEVSPVWAALIDRWDEIERSHLDEVGLGWSKAKSAPKTYKLMRSVIDGARSRPC